MMKITSSLFAAYLKCPTKCLLIYNGESGEDNKYAEWIRNQQEAYRTDGIKRLMNKSAPGECIFNHPVTDPSSSKWRFLLNYPIHTHYLNFNIDAVEQIPSKRKGNLPRLVPIRFICTNKLDKNDKLLIAFDAFGLSKMHGQNIEIAQIIHGDDYATHKIMILEMMGQIRELNRKIRSIFSNPSLPDIVLPGDLLYY